MAETTNFTAPTAREPLTLRPGDDAWGPFKFNCTGQIAEGVTITSVSVTAYDSSGTEASLVESSTSVVDDTYVQLYLQAPDGISAGEYYLRFELTLSNGGTRWLRFGPVTVLGWD